MGPLGLVLAASIISLSAGQDDDFDISLPLASLYWLDDGLCKMVNCEVDPQKTERREPEPGYIPQKGFYSDGYAKGLCDCEDKWKTERNRYPYPGYMTMLGSHSDGYAYKDTPAKPETSNSVETSDQSPDPGKTDGEKLLLSGILASTSKRSEYAENADGGSPETEVTSGEENVSGMSKEEDSQEFLSHEYQDMVRSVNG